MAEELSEASQVYYGVTGASGADWKNRNGERTGEMMGSAKDKALPDRRERTRDICKQMKTAGTLRVPALEK